MLMATAKQVTMMATHRVLPRPDLDEEIWLSPWIVEFSKNSERMAKAILSNWKPESRIYIETLHVLLAFHYWSIQTELCVKDVLLSV